MSSFQEWCPRWWWWFWQQIQRQVKRRRRKEGCTLLSSSLLETDSVFSSHNLSSLHRKWRRGMFIRNVQETKRMNFTASSKLSCLLFNFFLWVLSSSVCVQDTCFYSSLLRRDWLTVQREEAGATGFILLPRSCLSLPSSFNTTFVHPLIPVADTGQK